MPSRNALVPTNPPTRRLPTKAFFVFSLLLAPPSLAATGVTCQTEAADGSTLQVEILGSTDLIEGSILLVRALGVGVVEVETIVEAVRRKPEAQAVDLLQDCQGSIP